MNRKGILPSSAIIFSPRITRITRELRCAEMTKFAMTKPVRMTTDHRIASHSFGLFASGQLENSDQTISRSRKRPVADR